MDDKVQAYDLLEMLILKLALLNLDDDHHLMSSFHGIYEISLVMHIDAWLMTSPLGTPRGRYDEYSSKIFPQLRNQGMSIRRGETND
jgi:hypothetical protein